MIYKVVINLYIRYTFGNLCTCGGMEKDDLGLWLFQKKKQAEVEDILFLKKSLEF